MQKSPLGIILTIIGVLFLIISIVLSVHVVLYDWSTDYMGGFPRNMPYVLGSLILGILFLVGSMRTSSSPI